MAGGSQGGARAIAQARHELQRAGDEPERSAADTVEDVANEFPPN